MGSQQPPIEGESDVDAIHPGTSTRALEVQNGSPWLMFHFFALVIDVISKTDYYMDN